MFFSAIISSLSRVIAPVFRTTTKIGTPLHTTGATLGRTATSVKAGTTAISSGRISNAGIKAGVGIGATGAGVGVLGLGAQQLVDAINPITDIPFLPKGTGWLLIIGAVILLIVGLLFKR